MKDGFPANYPRPVEHRPEPAADPGGQSERRERAASSSSPCGVERQFGADFVVSADFVGNVGRNIARPAQPQPAGQRQRRRGRTRTSRTSSGATRSAVALPRDRPRRSRSASPTATATASPTRSASPSDQAPEHLAATSGAAAGHQRHRRRGKARATSTSATASSATSSSSCRSAPDRRSTWAGVGSAILGGWTVSGIYTARIGPAVHGDAGLARGRHAGCRT